MFCYSRSQIQSVDISGNAKRFLCYPLVDTTPSDRPDAIRCIVASLVGDGESGDSLVDDNEPIQPLQQPEIENYADPEWTPEPIDAGPGKSLLSLIIFSIFDFTERFPC